MKPAVFHPEALAELQQQVLCHEARSAGLGERFASQEAAAVELASSMPGVGNPYRLDTRRVFPKNFPQAVVYSEGAESLLILAIAPFKRKPGYWRDQK